MSRISAFTLIELLAGILIITTLLSLALTTLPGWVQQRQLRADVHQFISLIAVARHTAILQGTTVIMCPALPFSQRCAGRNEWHNGTVVFTDGNHNLRIDEADQVLARHHGLRRVKVIWRAFRNRSYLKFTATGMTDWQNGHFLFCPRDNNPRHAKQIILNYAGRTYVSSDRNGDGIDEDSRRQPLTCA
ncbi:MAG: GspH/FimT family protein [Pseudomonadota bacterium]